ncbi:hypothetical protein ACI65C_006044 [Semiaphis heraclei]
MDAQTDIKLDKIYISFEFERTVEYDCISTTTDKNDLLKGYELLDQKLDNLNIMDIDNMPIEFAYDNACQLNENNQSLINSMTEHEIVPGCSKYNLKRKHEHVDQSESETITNNVLTNLWSPPLNYLYPLLEQHAKSKIKFQHQWLGKFNWLCYSEKLQGAFCKYCAVFARSGGVGNQTLGSLVTTACQNWKNALKVV